MIELTKSYVVIWSPGYNKWVCRTKDFVVNGEAIILNTNNFQEGAQFALLLNKLSGTLIT
ncbi:hypothetical protein CMI37_07955 [Candidatus Pacearchaeota archaeon]|nr:hypothetical protein [Candidatus Pacearchaeota archaeon]